MDPLTGPPIPASGEAEEFLNSMPSGAVSLLSQLDDTPAEDEEATRAGRPVEGEEGDTEIKLSDEEKADLARDLLDILRRYDQQVRWRLEREQEILDNYDLEPSEQNSGEGGEASRVPSELTLTMVDQAASRVITNTMSVDPIMAVKPILGEGEEAAERAASVERGLNNYAMHSVNFQNLLPVYLHETGKLGTVVLRVAWEREERVYSYFDEQGKLQTKDKNLDSVRTRLVENHNAIIWPMRLVDWQEAEVAGHRAYFTESRFRSRLKGWGFDDEAINEMVRMESYDTRSQERQRNQGVEASGADPENLQLTELWCHLPIEDENEKAYARWWCILHEPSRTILKIYRNTRRRQTHPYYPIRWKLKGEFAWGDGVGHECLYADSVDETLRNLELDNILSGAFKVIEVVSGSLPDRLLTRLVPGQMVPVDKIGEEINPIQIGGEAPEIPAARQRNKGEAYETVGSPPVTRGMGDPTMKSGAGTGSTLALIEQAQGKYDVIAQRIRLDLSAVYTEILELVADNASDGVLVKYMSEQDASVWRSMRWTPPQESIPDAYHIYAQAPSASTSREARKMTYLAIWQFAGQYVGWLQQSVLPLLQQSQPGVVPRFVAEIAGFMHAVARQVIEHHDMPGMKDRVPAVPEPTPPEQMVTQLQQTIQQQQQQLQQMMSQMQGQPQQPAPEGMPS